MKKIVVITSSRADFGIMENLISKLIKKMEVKIYATGTHVEEKFGFTSKLIIESGFKVDKEFPINMIDSSDIGIANSMSTALTKITEALVLDAPDAVMLLGDRFEIMAAAMACYCTDTKIIHLHGGEKTLGSKDELSRNVITKLSHLHFPSCEEYKNRIIQMGENPKCVLNYGALGVENSVINLKDLPKEHYALLFHPEHATKDFIKLQMEELYLLVQNINEKIVLFGSNADSNNEIIRTYIEKMKLLPNIEYHESLAPEEFHKMLLKSHALIGNSSSGIIEAPSLMVPTINIGDRQKGRIAAKSVINVPCEYKEILDAIERTKSLNISDFDNPYYCENSSDKICEAINSYLNNEHHFVKEFYDIDFINNEQ